MSELSPRLHAYLKSWFTTSTRNKAASGITVELTFDDFLSLIDKRQMRSLQKAIDNNSIRALMNEKNPYAYVLSWVSYAACSTRVFSKQTARVCSRMTSAKINLPQLGDKLRPEHAAAISEGLTGKPKSDDHRNNISLGSKGQPKAPWSEDRKAARRAQIAAKKAAKLEGANSQ